MTLQSKPKKMKQVETHEWNLIKDVRLTITDPACPLNAQIPAQG